MASSTTINTSVRTDSLSAAKSTSRRNSASDDSVDSPFEQELQSRSRSDAQSNDDQSSDQKDAKASDKAAKPKAKKAKPVAKNAKVEEVDDSEVNEAEATQATAKQATPVQELPDADESEVVKEVIAKDQPATKQVAKAEVDPASAGKVAIAPDVVKQPVAKVANTDDTAPAEVDPTKAKVATKSIQPKPAVQKPADENEVAETEVETVQPVKVEKADVKVAKSGKVEAQPKSATVKNIVSPLQAAPLDPKNGDATDHRQQKNDGNIQIDQQLIDESDFSDSDSDFDLASAIVPDKKSAVSQDDLNALGAALAADPGAKAVTHTATAAPTLPPPAPEVQFATDNHPQIVTGVHGQLLPNGGTMSIRLDPPELGDVQLLVHMKDGVMSAAFQTSNDQATHLLSHSLGDLRTALEASGVTVDRLHVEQAPKDSHARNDNPDSRQQHGQTQDSPARRDQQRRELLQRMWKKLSDGGDPLDLVAETQHSRVDAHVSRSLKLPQPIFDFLKQRMPNRLT